MEITDWTQLISTIGFPIVAYVMMFYMCNTTIKENTDAINRLISHIDTGETKNA